MLRVCILKLTVFEVQLVISRQFVAHSYNMSPAADSYIIHSRSLCFIYTIIVSAITGGTFTALVDTQVWREQW